MTEALRDLSGDRDRVNAMIDRGMSFGQIRDAIGRFDVPEDRKPALSMLAWSRLNPHVQERIAQRREMGMLNMQ
jgi:hypothetical protein